MKKILLLFILISSYGLSAQEAVTTTKSFNTYRELSPYMQASPGAFKSGIYGFANPAILNYNRSNSDLIFTFFNRHSDFGQFKDVGIFQGNENIGLGAIYHEDIETGNYIVDYRYSLGFGDRDFSMGIAHGFVGGDKSSFKRANTFSSMISRPMEYLSLGFSYITAYNNSDEEGVAEIALRPFGNDYPLTFFADAATFKFGDYSDLTWSGGVSWEFADGVRINGRYFDNKMINVGLDISFGTMGIGAINTSSEESKPFQSYTVRLGGEDRTFLDDIQKPQYYVQMNLAGAVKYQNYKFFDNSRTLVGLLGTIDRAQKDETIKGLVINAVGLRTSKALLWELRERLREFKMSGKKVIIFIERVGIDQYHFASVADEIIMDEFGSMSIEGYSMARSYYKNMLEKLGIGYDELRFYKYKSAVESFTRENYSEGDREQRQALIDSWFNTTKREVARDREGMSEAKFEELVNKQIFYYAAEAKEEGLVDRFGRWTDVKKMMKEIDPINNTLVSESYVYHSQKPIDDKWKEQTSSIAVIYALGVCSMDQGIKARKLVKDMKAALKSDRIKAVVLRVDSPGGDALASEYITNEIRKYKNDMSILNKKPIIVSQGMVAASGGYWLSMDADQIVASPITITGSIGVISSWIYDKGVAKDLGITTDVVKTSKYSALGQSFSVPLIGLGLPVAPLNEDERGQFEKSIKRLYKDFVTKVSEGRGVEYEKIHDVAQGRIWSGTDGKEKGLVDKIGGLAEAIKIAKKEAGIPEDEKTYIYEYPKLDMFNIDALISKFIGFNVENVKDNINSLEFRVENNGLPMPILPIEYIEYENVDIY